MWKNIFYGADKGMEQIKRIKKLTEELLQHCHNYYALDNPTISDAEYDNKFDELFTLENEANFYLANSPTRRVQGSVLDCFNKIEHSKPMLSAAKTKDINEIKKFIGGNAFYCSFKLDGLTLVVRYKDGKFVQAVTRGTGIIGEDVTEQAKMITNLPMQIPYDGDLELRGECVVSWDNFNKINEGLESKYSHPRNLAAGSLRNLDTNITKERNLSYVVFECVSDLYDEDVLFDSKWDELGYLDYLGFETVERCHGTVEDCVEDMKPERYKYPVDGAIFELCMKSYSKSLAATSHHENCRMALKWADTTYETTLLDVEWSTTRTGSISPVAIFEEVDLDGALTTRATLHNLSIIKQLELGIGDTITVYRSNMVIPKIDDNFTRSNTLEIPTKCPCCGFDTVIKNTDNSQVLMCPNPDCSAKKIAQFTHFVSRKCMNIDGLSEKTLETLISHGFLRNFVDIYRLSNHRQQLIQLDGYGQKSIDNLLKSIKDSRNVKLENFIAALGIPNIGLSAAKTISKACDGDWNKLWDMWNYEYDFTQLDDFGEIMANSFVKYFDANINNILNIIDNLKFIQQEERNDNSLEGLKFCITGSFSQSRDGLKKQLEAKGAKFVSSVSKSLDILFCGEKAGGKLTKAQQLGIRVADENELMKMLED
jgi:DNA ligase (NAD+)